MFAQLFFLNFTGTVKEQKMADHVFCLIFFKKRLFSLRPRVTMASQETFVGRHHIRATVL